MKEYLEKILKKSGWISIVGSVIFAILGAILIWKPEETIKWISYLLGTIFILAGIYKIMNYANTKGKYDLYNYDMIYGMMAIVIGIVTIAYSNTIASILRIIIGVWIMYSSFVRISSAIKLKTAKVKVWPYCLVLAILMFLGGLYIIINSGTIVMTVGIIMVAYSVIDIIEDVIFMRNVKELF